MGFLCENRVGQRERDRSKEERGGFEEGNGRDGGTQRGEEEKGVVDLYIYIYNGREERKRGGVTAIGGEGMPGLGRQRAVSPLLLENLFGN